MLSGSILFSVRVGTSQTCPKVVPHECRPLALEVVDEKAQAEADAKAIVPFVRLLLARASVDEVDGWGVLFIRFLCMYSCVCVVCFT